jgi:hypothetical protein
MFDDPGFIILTTICALAVFAAFGALLWAAVADGRDERSFRAH